MQPYLVDSSSDKTVMIKSVRDDTTDRVVIEWNVLHALT